MTVGAGPAANRRDRPKSLWPALAALGAFALVIALARPWGEYPLNDDWQYAWVAKRLAETGHFAVDVGVGPTLVGQSLIALPFLKIFGFSHLLLRAVTLGMAALLILLVERILALASVRPTLRAAAALTLALNPFFLSLSATFMTEIYGFTLALLGAWIWFRGRSRANASLISWSAALATAAVCAAAFWTRQVGVWIYPCLAGSALLGAWLRGERREIRAAAPKLATATALFTILVYAYFPWSRAHALLKREFADPLSHLLQLHFHEALRDWIVAWIYLGLFLVPLTIGFSKKILLSRPRATGIAVLGVAAGMILCFVSGQKTTWPSDNSHSSFPLLGNLLYNAGLGPITLSDVYLDHRGIIGVAWPKAVWWFVYVIAAGFAALWVPVVLRWRKSRPNPRWEIGATGLAFALGTAAITFQGVGGDAFDRYLFPALIGMLLWMSVTLEDALGESRLPQARVWLALIPFALFGIGGLHDYFAWNDARWEAVGDAAKLGIHAERLDGGYEVNGWLTRVEGAPLPDWYTGFYRVPKPDRIVFTSTPGYHALRTYPIRGWLAAFGPLILEAKDEERDGATGSGSSLRQAR